MLSSGVWYAIKWYMVCYQVMYVLVSSSNVWYGIKKCMVCYQVMYACILYGILKRVMHKI